MSLAQTIMHHAKKTALFLGTAVAISPLSVLAEESTGMPQLKPEVFSPQIIWLAVAFVILYLVMSKKALPQVAKALGEREDRLAADLDEAEEHRLTSIELEAAYEKTLAEAKAEAGGNLATAREELKQGLEVQKTAVDKKISTKIEAAEAEIKKAKDEAMGDLEKVAVEACQTIVAKLTGEAVAKATAAKAVKTKLKAVLN